jgi:hypothetical protein
MRPENFQSDIPFDPDDVVDRATQTLREMPMPDGPSADLISNTQAALCRAQAERGMRLFWGMPTARVAALIAIFSGVAIAYWAGWRHNLQYKTPNIVRVNPPAPSNPIVAPQPQPQKNPPIPTPTPTPPPTPEQHPQAPTPPAPILADGILTGRIVFDGFAPPPRPLVGFNMTAECVKLHGGPIYDESMVVARDGALANVVVSVSDGLSGWLREEYPPPPPAILDQKGCVFLPHVVPVMVGQQLSLRNSDPFLHNVHVLAVNNPAANVGQPSTSESQTLPFEAPEVFRVRCDVHPWMEAWVRVVDNPFFAVTDRDGRFTIRGLPPGTYTLKAWHEQLGVREQQIVIAPGEGTAADFTFHAGPGRGESVKSKG